jgi:hypothetical protein
MCTGLAIAVGILLIVLSIVIFIFISKVPLPFWHKGRVERIAAALWDRYRGTATAPDIQNADRLITYVERIVDRQINKARGILPFNSIIIGVLSFERYRLDTQNGMYAGFDLVVLLLFTMLCLGISSYLCLWLFLVRWGKDENYGAFDTELKSTLFLIRWRSILIECATIISAWTLIFSAVLIPLVELKARI